MKQQKDYWNKFILDWDRSAYESRSAGMGFVEWLATRFRGVLLFRMEYAIDSLTGLVRGKTVLELGCGTGRVCRALAHHGTSRVIGVDISDLATQQAERSLTGAGLPPEAFAFHSGDVSDLEQLLGLSDITPDLVVGLGILQYLTDEELASVLKTVSPADLFFEFHEDKWSVLEVIHTVYRSLKPSLPFYRKISRDSLRSALQAAGYQGLRYSRVRGVSFASTLEGLEDWEEL